MYPASFTNAAKLETQNGIRNSRKICHPSNSVVPLLDDRVLMSNAQPIIALSPSDVSHRPGRGSKRWATFAAHQMA